MGKPKILRGLLAAGLLLAAGCAREDTDRLTKIGRILADRTGQVVEKVKNDFAESHGKARGARPGAPDGPDRPDAGE